MQLSKALVIQKGQNKTMNPLGFMVRRSMYMYFVYAYGHSGQSGSQAMRNLHGSCGAICAHQRKKKVRYVEYEVCFFLFPQVTSQGNHQVFQCLTFVY